MRTWLSVAAAAGALLLLGGALPVVSAPAQELAPADPDEYCVAANTQYDPTDVKRPDAPPIELPPGFVRHRISIAGFRTTVIERGPRNSQEAVVFMHGNPGSSLDFVNLLGSVPRGTRVVALDIIGFGEADKPYDFAYDFPSSRPIVDRAFRELGIERMHLVGHDVGSVLGVDYVARHPEKLASATIIAGGILIGYTDHHFHRVWKTPGLGEETMRGADREGFISLLQAHNPRPLPREFLDRNYDHFDRGTRCAILKLYRSVGDLNALAQEQAAALAPHNRPALVIWGDRDPFLPTYLAESNRRGFPSADIHVFANSGHWPFVDSEPRTLELMSAFFRTHVREQAGKRIALRVRPRRVPLGRRTRIRARVSLAEAPGQPVAGAVVSAGRRRARTGRGGRAILRIRPRRAGTLRLVARKSPLKGARVRLRVRGG